MTPSQAKERGIKVKPLVWQVYCSNAGNCKAESGFGEYIVEDCHENGIGLWLPTSDDGDEPPMGYFGNMEAAKAAAQADYEARILEALE